MDEPMDTTRRRGTGDLLPDDPNEENEVDLREIGRILMRQWRVLVVVAGLLLMVGAPVVILKAQKQRFTSSASFVTESESSSGGVSGLMGLAAQVGFRLPASGSTESPQFYMELLRTRRILGPVVNRQYEIPAEGGVVRTTLVEAFAAPELTPPEREAIAIARLGGNMLRVEMDRPTGIVSFSVTAPQPALAHQAAEYLLDEIQQYNMSKRQSRAAAERAFVQGRLEDARAELLAAEQDIQRFLRQNREFQNSPELTFEHDRLRRQMNVHRDVVASLTQAVEQARIEQVRNTPIISVVEEPSMPLWPDQSLLKRNLLIVTLLALAGAMAAAFLVEALGWRRTWPWNWLRWDRSR